jgi:insulysin
MYIHCFVRYCAGCNYAYTMLNDAHQLHAIEIYLQCFQQTTENNALLELFGHLVDEPCFDQLRTKEQLGYIVNSGVRRSRGVQGFRVIVQSSRELDHVNRRIELFLDSVRVSSIE